MLEAPEFAVEVSGLRKTYDGHAYAVDGVDISVPRGAVFALLGPNGAGKTTIVEILEGFRKATSGRVSVLGMDPQHGGRALRERIGIVLQECQLDPYLTVVEAMRMQAPLYPHPRPVGEVLELIGLADQARARMRTLSGGQKRRLDLGLALVGDPELVFLDEPTTGFDPSARRASWDLVRDLCSLGKTVLLTTHYMEEAQVLASRVVIIAKGRVVASGTPDDIGGHARDKTIITLPIPVGVGAADMPSGALVEGGHVSIEVRDGVTATLHRLTSWALDRGVELEGLTVARPSLEDVYLELTGAAAHPTEDQAP